MSGKAEVFKIDRNRDRVVVIYKGDEPSFFYRKIHRFPAKEPYVLWLDNWYFLPVAEETKREHGFPLEATAIAEVSLISTGVNEPHLYVDEFDGWHEVLERLNKVLE